MLSKSLIVLFISFTTISFAQIEKKTILNEKNFIVNYYQNLDYFVVLIETKYTPIIYTDINKNNASDSYIDKLFSVIEGNSLCVANILENDMTTMCGQTTKSILIINQNEYQFIIPKNELNYIPTDPIYLFFGAFDIENNITYSFKNNTKSFIFY